MKLVKPAQFNRPKMATIQLHLPQDLIAVTVTVIVTKEGHVELNGHVKELETATRILNAGIARLTQWHAQQAATIEGPKEEVKA